MAAVWRFLGDTTVVRVGDTVAWTNLSQTVHTITFGPEPANLVPLPWSHLGFGRRQTRDYQLA
jgi:plastocyanin